MSVDANTVIGLIKSTTGFLVDQVGRKIVKDASTIQENKNNPNCLLNPDLSKVSGIPPHLWRKEGDFVVPALHNRVIEKIKKSSLSDVEKDASLSHSQREIKESFLTARQIEKQLEVVSANLKQELEKKTKFLYKVGALIVLLSIIVSVLISVHLK